MRIVEDVSVVLLFKDVLHTGFKLREQREPVEDTLSNSVSSFVVMRVHGRGSGGKEDKHFISEF